MNSKIHRVQKTECIICLIQTNWGVSQGNLYTFKKKSTSFNLFQSSLTDSNVSILSRWSHGSPNLRELNPVWNYFRVQWKLNTLLWPDRVWNGKTKGGNGSIEMERIRSWIYWIRKLTHGQCNAMHVPECPMRFYFYRKVQSNATTTMFYFQVS